ncbi:MAG: glycerol-3-phosphate 1-O-acyltransferase PlsY [Terrimicrobiaceae bacterium]|nr:glycerol-3-phosphate 1-O-acyltransferase PlsY [Terrimicrobiaceae bacterium]
MFYLAVALGAYLIGSFPSGYLIGRARGVDLRRAGSGNIGATNALRVLGKKWGYLCFALDIGKGALAVWLAKLVAAPVFGLDPTGAALLAAIGALLGHTFPVWLGFKGGKGIATSGGIALALFPPIVFCLSILSWMIAFLAFRIVSIASLAATTVLGVTLIVLARLGRAEPAVAAIGVAMTVLVFWLHRGNISRLAQGTEPRFEKRRKS